MLTRILAFEFRYQVRQPLFWIALALFFLLTFGAITTDVVVVGGSIGSVNRNAPFVIFQMLAVMTKFPVVRDLVLDRRRMFDDLKRIKGGVPIQGRYDLGPGPRMSPAEQEAAYPLSRCMSCGCCLEVCPQISPRSEFIGPAAVSQVRLFNAHPTGEEQRRREARGADGAGGPQRLCGNAQSWVRACQKEIPLTGSIGEMGRQVTLHMIRIRSLWAAGQPRTETRSGRPAFG